MTRSSRALLVLLAAAAVPARAQNPIVDPGTYIADPTARVFGYYCSWGGNVATLEVPAGDGRSWTSVSAPVRGASGVHAVWLRFHGPGEDVARLDWLLFEQ